jgi:hypothetical protein
MLKRRWRMVHPPFHVYYYSPKTITKLLEKYGFKVLCIEHYGKYYSLGSILKVMGFFNMSILRDLPIKVNFGEIMTVVAMKE